MEQEVHDGAPEQPVGAPDEAKEATWLGGLIRLIAAIVGMIAVPIAVAMQDSLWLAYAGKPRPAWMDPARMIVATAPVGLALVVLIQRRRGPRRPALTTFAVAALVSSLLFGLLLWSPFGRFVLEDTMEQRPFDATAWRAVAYPEDGEAWMRMHEWRVRMVDDLMASGALDGLHKDDVVALLGPDDGEAGTGRGRGYFPEYELVYHLGPQRGPIRIDSEWLVIDFDSRGRVAEYRLAWD